MKRRNIVSKTGYLLSLLSLVLFGLCNILHSRADKEIIKSDICPSFAVNSFNAKDAATWTYHTDNCHICNAENTKKSWLLTKFLPTNNAELVHVDITLSFTDCLKCKNQLLKVLAIQENLPKDIADGKVIRKFDKLSVLKEIHNKSLGTQTHHIEFVSTSNGVSMVFLVEGACLVIYNIEVFSFFCNDTSTDGVHLPRTVSPASGNRTVNSSCYNDTVTSSKQVFGLCGSDGEWKFVTPCFCKKGYTFDTTGCHGCPANTYKDHIRNEPCSPCPSNSKSAPQAVMGCECEVGYYRFSGQDNYTDICHGIPSAVEQVKFILKTEKSVVIQWSPPLRKINKVFYDVECFKCRRDICSVPCGSKIVYKPSKSNLTTLNVTVENLEPDTQYRFVVRSKNNNSYMINKSLWLTAGETFKTEAHSSSAGVSKVLTVGVPIVVVILVIIIIVLVVILLRRRKQRRKDSKVINHGVDLPLIGEKNYIDPTTYDDPERAVTEFAKELSRDIIKFECILGGGEFGDVYKGTLQRHNQPITKVAIKTLKPGSTQKNRKDFLIEASVMGQFKNLNVVTLEGVVTKSVPLLIVTEFMENGSLDEYLKSNDGLLKPLQLFGMARGVSSGMAYLAGMHFVHRDLAARNVLVNVNLACKVADFGLSRDIGEESEYETQGGRIPVRWTAPEAIRYRKFSTASDVWSYGILLWEIMSFAERPYWDWGNLEVLERVDGGYRLPPPMNCPKIVHQLMMECWDSDRTKRPAFPDIVKIVDDWIRSPEKLKEEKIKRRKSEVLDITTFSSVKEWLEAFKMGMYASNFTRAGYRNLDDVVKLSEEELLAKVGVRLVGHRHKIYQRIKEMNEHMQLVRDKSVRI